MKGTKKILSLFMAMLLMTTMLSGLTLAESPVDLEEDPMEVEEEAPVETEAEAEVEEQVDPEVAEEAAEEADESIQEEAQPAEEAEEPQPVVLNADGIYTSDSDAGELKVVLVETSTNNHTNFLVIWRGTDGIIYTAVSATHNLKSMRLKDVTLEVNEANADVYGNHVPIQVDDHIYKPEDYVKGNTKDAHWTVFKFPAGTINPNESGVFAFEILSHVGGGHEIINGKFKVDAELISVEAEKVWTTASDDDELPETLPNVWFKLYRKVEGDEDGVSVGEILQPNKDNNYKVVWNEVEKYSTLGYLYTYYVQEVDEEGNDVTPPMFEKVEEGLKVTNIFTIEEISLTVNKVWEGGPLAGTEVELKLYRNVEGGEKELVDTVTTENLTYTWENLPKTTKDGQEYVYSVEETALDDYGTEYTSETDEDGNYTIEVKNTYEIPTDDITVYKIWTGDKSIPRPEIYFTLLRKLEGGELEPVPGFEPVLITADVTSATWKEVELTDAKGTPYIFTVVESFKDDADTNENWDLGSYNPDKKEIENTLIEPNGKLTVKKELIEQLFDPGIFGKDGEALKFKFKVTGPYGYEKTFELEAGKSIILDKLYFGKYVVEELEAHGYEPEYKPAAEVVLTGEVGEVEVKVNNKHVEDPAKDPNLVEVKAKKVWDKGPEADHKAVKFILKRHLGDKVQVVNADPVIEGKAPEFTYTWSGLDKHSPEGYEYTYSVEEEGVKDGYVMVGDNKYKVEQKGNTITNRFVEPPKEKEKEKLPSTGETGTPLLIVGGILLLLAALFFLKKTRKA